MPHAHTPALSVESAAISASESAEFSQALASSPYSAPAFFLGWAAVGATAAWILTRRGHDPRTMFGLGVGLGPLMAIVTADTVRCREAEARPRVLHSGVPRCGTLDVLVVVGDRPEAVRAVNDTLDAIRLDVRTLTVARVVPYEWLTEHSSSSEISDAGATLAEAERHLIISGATRALWPGTTRSVIQRFRDLHQRPLVLIPIDEAEGEQTSTSA